SRELAQRIYRREASGWSALLTSWIAAVYILAALGLAALWAGRRWPIERPLRASRILLHLLASAVFSVVELTLEVVVYTRLGVLGSQPFGKAVGSFLVAGFHFNVLNYWTILGLQAGWRYYRGYRERELRSSEL